MENKTRLAKVSYIIGFAFIVIKATVYVIGVICNRKEGSKA